MNDLPNPKTRWPSGRRIALGLVFMAMAAMLHFIIREHYPPDIDRSKWLAASVLLVLRNSLIGVSIGLPLRHHWLGLILGMFVPPILLLAIYGLPC